MIDNNKIREYEVKMTAYADAGFKLGVFSIRQLVGSSGTIPEKTLHEGFEYIIAKEKKVVEENRAASPEEKEREKSKREHAYKCLEEQLKLYLESQSKLEK